MNGWSLDDRTKPLVVLAELYDVPRLDTMKIDHNLLTALTEQWSQDTHTFQLIVGETTLHLRTL